eukprot:630110-Rhodomonas_salina.1
MECSMATTMSCLLIRDCERGCLLRERVTHFTLMHHVSRQSEYVVRQSVDKCANVGGCIVYARNRTFAA